MHDIPHSAANIKSPQPKGVFALQVVEDVLSLDKIARKMKRRRFEDGALRLDTVKLAFSLDSDGNPDVCRIYGAPPPPPLSYINGRLAFRTRLIIVCVHCCPRFHINGTARTGSSSLDLSAEGKI